MRLHACTVDELSDGEMRLVEGGPEPIALYRVAGAYYATADTCSHGQSSLSDEGELDGFAIECGWHFGRFDVRTGAAIALPCNKPIRIFPTVIQGDEVLIEIDD
jgi:p-cumate 2,3-dioxygenase ferredoxin component